MRLARSHFLEEMFKLDRRVPGFAMMRETAPAKAVTVQKPAVREPPVKFRSGKHTAIVKEDRKSVV